MVTQSLKRLSQWGSILRNIRHIKFGGSNENRGSNWRMMFWTTTVVHLPRHVRLFATPWTAAHQASLSLTISRSLPKFMFIASVMPSSYLILWDPLLLLPLMFPSIRDFSNESSVCIRWSKHWSFSFSISPSSKYSVLISLKIDWFNLLAVQVLF